jgi:hypothetical protein
MQFDKRELKEWEANIANEFPEFILVPSPEVLGHYEKSLGQKFADMPQEKENLCNLRYGFECDSGWKSIIRDYFTQMRHLIKYAKDSGDEVHYSTFIFKEKFGEIRDQGNFYGPDRKKYWDEYAKLNHMFMSRSGKICEVCGEEGTLRKRGKNWGWVKCLCNSHADTLGYSMDLH